MATKRFNFKFHCEKDADIIQRLSNSDNMQDYIRSLIRSDILADSFRLVLLENDKAKYNHALNEYIEANCPGVYKNDSKNYCTDCKYWNGSVCDIESSFKHEVNSEYGKAVQSNGCSN